MLRKGVQLLSYLRGPVLSGGLGEAFLDEVLGHFDYNAGGVATGIRLFHLGAEDSTGVLDARQDEKVEQGGGENLALLLDGVTVGLLGLGHSSSSSAAARRAVVAWRRCLRTRFWARSSSSRIRRARVPSVRSLRRRRRWKNPSGPRAVRASMVRACCWVRCTSASSLRPASPRRNRCTSLPRERGRSQHRC